MSLALRSRAATALLFVVAGCAGNAPPVAAPPVAAPPVAPSRAANDAPAVPVEAFVPDTAPVPAPVPAPEPAVVRHGNCYVRVVLGHPCHGAPLGNDAPPMRIEVCDGCRTHDDCRASRGGRCVEQAGNTCTLAARVCRYPNDACSQCEGSPTFERRGCVNDQLGHAVCMLMGAPPPAAPHR